MIEGLGKNLPVGYRVVLGGSSMAFRESMSSLLFAMVLGISSLFQVNWDKIRRRQRDYGYSVITLVSFLAMVYIGMAIEHEEH